MMHTTTHYNNEAPQIERSPFIGSPSWEQRGRVAEMNRFRSRGAKRLFDIVVSVFCTAVIFWWLFPMIIMLQKLLNPGPVFYKRCRAGLNGKEFVCYKFRSMKPRSGDESVREAGLRVNLEREEITKFGWFLRKTNLDELPQFINILKGEMSVVGPRPHDVSENADLLLKIPHYVLRQRIRPGLTGWAQVHGYHGTTAVLEKMTARTNYDLWYIDNWSLTLDLKIVLRTAWLMAKAIRYQSMQLMTER